MKNLLIGVQHGHWLVLPVYKFAAEYDDIPYKESSFRSPLMTDVIQNASFRWSNNGPSSFKSFKKKLQEATSEIRNAGW